jgi:peptidyl-tRNA hydrolase
MKEQTLIEMKNKIDSMIRIIQTIIDDQQHLTSLSVGTLETVKLMPGYDEAIKQITEKVTPKEKNVNELE